MTEYAEECCLLDCPCHEFALKRPQEASSDSAREINLSSLKTSPIDRGTPKNATSDDRTAQNSLRGLWEGFEGSEDLERQEGASTTIPDFEHEWDHAPRSRRLRVEQEDALFWYTAGGRAKEEELSRRYCESSKNESSTNHD